MFIKRRGDRSVVYRSVREGDRVRKRYVGSGRFGVALLIRDLDARIDAIRERDRDREQERRIKGWFDAIEATARAALTTAGYRRHHRGEWRRRNVTQLDQDQAGPISPAAPEGTRPGRRRRMFADESPEAAEIRRQIQQVPEAAWFLGSASDDLLDAILRRYYADHPIRAESMRAQVEQVRADLAGPGPTAMERLLAERAAICWLACNAYERAAEQGQAPTPREAVARQRKIDGAHRRFLSAVRTLATVRKLKLPDVRITIDQRAVHLGERAEEPRDRIAEAGLKSRIGLSK